MTGVHRVILTKGTNPEQALTEMTLPAKNQPLHSSSDLEFCSPPQGLFGLWPQSDISGGPFNFLILIISLHSVNFVKEVGQIMIEFYRLPDCDDCETIEEALKEMVIAHKIIVIEPGQWPEILPADTPLPALVDNGQVFTGRADLAAHLRELEKVVADWRRFQSDACYIDDDGETC